MAKTYEVLSGASTRTKDGETVFLTPRIQHTVAEHLTEARIKELVKGGVLREHGEDDPGDESITLPSPPADGFVRPLTPPPDPPDPDLKWLETRDGPALSVGPTRYRPGNASTSRRELMDAFARLADLRDEDPVALRAFIEKHGALMLCAGCGRQPIFHHAGAPYPNAPCVQHNWEAWEPDLFRYNMPAETHLVDTYRAYGRMLRSSRWLARALREHMERETLHGERSLGLWREIRSDLAVDEQLRPLVGDHGGYPFHKEWRLGKSHLENTRRVLGACLSWWLQCGRSTPMVQWRTDGPSLSLHFHQNIRLNGLGLWEDLVEGLWQEVQANTPGWVRCRNDDHIPDKYFERERQPGRPARYCPACRRAGVPARDRSRRHRRST